MELGLFFVFSISFIFLVRGFCLLTHRLHKLTEILSFLLEHFIGSDKFIVFKITTDQKGQLVWGHNKVGAHRGLCLTRAGMGTPTQPLLVDVANKQNEGKNKIDFDAMLKLMIIMHQWGGMRAREFIYLRESKGQSVTLLFKHTSELIFRKNLF